MSHPFSNLSRPAGRASRLAAAALSLICLALFLLLGGSSPARPADPVREFPFHHDGILGTSLDLLLLASKESDAEHAERVVLDEIERLRRILSTYDSTSEISRLNRATEPFVCSIELIEVLRAYEDWYRRSQGAFNGQLGELIQVWKRAEQAGSPPSAATLEPLLQQLQQPGWKIDDANRTVTRLTHQPLNVNAIGKGYILAKAAAAAREKVPSLRGLLLSIGGDLAMFGNGTPWRIGVTDPARPQDNAAPLAVLELKGGAVATSGNYQRYFTIDGKRYSHILDPRTGRPAEGVASATVVAADNVTANALATTLCVLTPEEGLRLVERTPGASCLLIAGDRHFKSKGWTGRDVSPPLASDCTVAPANPWPAGFETSITLILTEQKTTKYRRPYVAVWIENADGKPVRSLACWGNASKYQKDLTAWWRLVAGDTAVIKAVTRATRSPGRYQLAWDGRDDKGNPVEQGTYKVQVEVHREHGKHVRQTGTIECRADKAAITLAKTPENDDTLVEYGPKGK